jgi:hypothetical protein
VFGRVPHHQHEAEKRVSGKSHEIHRIPFGREINEVGMHSSFSSGPALLLLFIMGQQTIIVSHPWTSDYT